MSTMMKACVAGGNRPIRLEDCPSPVPGTDQLLIRTRAVALNNADLTPRDEDHIAGYEFSGEVVAVGSGVDPAIIGERVAGTAPSAFAEFVLVHHRHVIVIPRELSFEEAAPLPTALLTEFGALSLAGTGPGDSVLITAASSGIGLIGVQIAKLMGAMPVIATTRSASKRAMLEGLGADVVIVTNCAGPGGAGWAAQVLEATDGLGVTTVLDHVAGEMLNATVPATRRGGQIISVGRLSGAVAPVNLYGLAVRQTSLRSVSYGFNPSEVIGDLLAGVSEQILPAVADGRVRAVVDAVFPFTRMPAAVERLSSGQAKGKIVLSLPWPGRYWQALPWCSGAA
ncbi:NADPH:quinone reductase [Arthrobacter alpinus]|uniref:NADPH:quinone reductase n=1 Tax=Arthrobacter alpinus TaxID=656366 RepID=A0A1H5IGR7_9MICC|nr:zinc-binding dehydrogenase [Arthrobacter alpinus]SEE39390.1 NADPH:quinone reductase [Arthrobacter alpinus]